MKKLSFISVLLALLTIICFSSVGCTGKKPASDADTLASDTTVADTQAMDSTEKLIEETPMPKAADELFDDFVFNFAANRKLQLSRVHFPLHWFGILRSHVGADRQARHDGLDDSHQGRPLRGRTSYYRGHGHRPG